MPKAIPGLRATTSNTYHDNRIGKPGVYGLQTDGQTDIYFQILRLYIDIWVSGRTRWISGAIAGSGGKLIAAWNCSIRTDQIEVKLRNNQDRHNARFVETRFHYKTKEYHSSCIPNLPDDHRLPIMRLPAEDAKPIELIFENAAKTSGC